MDQIVLTPLMVFHMWSMDLESSLSSTGGKKHVVLSVCWLMFLIACLAETQFNSPDLLWWMCPPWSLPDVPDVTCFCSVLVRVGIATASRSKQAKGSWELGHVSRFLNKATSTVPHDDQGLRNHRDALWISISSSGCEAARWRRWMTKHLRSHQETQRTT